MDVRAGPQRRLNAELVLWTVALEKILESPLYCKKVKPVNPKGNQFWIFIGRIDTEAESLLFWPPNMKNWLTGKDLDAGEDWIQEERGTTEDEMVGWNHLLNEHEFEQTLGDVEGQGRLACYSPWGHKESDMTEQLNNDVPLDYKICNAKTPSWPSNLWSSVWFPNICSFWWINIWLKVVGKTSNLSSRPLLSLLLQTSPLIFSGLQNLSYRMTILNQMKIIDLSNL